MGLIRKYLCRIGLHSWVRTGLVCRHELRGRIRSEIRGEYCGNGIGFDWIEDNQCARCGLEDNRIAVETASIRKEEQAKWDGIRQDRNDDKEFRVMMDVVGHVSKVLAETSSPTGYSAYLIVICDKQTNAVKSACIWSSPEWEQSICLPDRTYVAYEVKDVDYQSARNALVKVISEPRSRYHWLLSHFADRYADNVRPSCVVGDSWSFGQPTEPGDYEWASVRHSLNPNEVTVYRNYNGDPRSWGRDVWFRKISGDDHGE